MDIVLRLRELRRMRGLSQRDASIRSGVGEKTISSFETGERIDSLKISQLRRLLQVYGVTEKEFFNGTVDSRIAPWEQAHDACGELASELRALPPAVREMLTEKFQLMIDSASRLQSGDRASSRGLTQRDTAAEWQMLTSRN